MYRKTLLREPEVKERGSQGKEGRRKEGESSGRKGGGNDTSAKACLQPDDKVKDNCIPSQDPETKGNQNGGDRE